MLRVVVDTNVYISAIFWGGKPRHIIDLGRDGKIQIFTSEDIEQEILNKLITKFGLNSGDADKIMVDFSTFTKPIRVSRRIHVVKDDPDDDKFIECAVECSAEFIVSGDNHLLKKKKYKGIDIVNAATFLKGWH
ncbi:MAG: putative toxin-antitoxin system toxin component, PIN family [Thermodesulfobacteriota bacterium]|nr:putative toxin-antitoxin system toxin component, PIN family [Thermodesulfobacteriota bacterium]